MYALRATPLGRIQTVKLVDQVLEVPTEDRLRVAWPTGPLLDPAARKRAGERISRERAEEAQLRAAGLLDDDRKAR